MKSVVFASREMSYLLVGSSRWWVDDVRGALKVPGFIRPCIEAFLLYDQIVLDPAVSVDDIQLDGGALHAGVFRELVDQKIIVSPPVIQADIETLKRESLDDLVTSLKLLPPQSLSHWTGRFHYDYLLESPWWKFVREIDLAASNALHELGLLGLPHLEAARGFLPFLFSTIWSVKVGALLKLPSLLSQVEYAIREEMLEVGLVRPLSVGFPTPALARLRSISRDTSEKFSVSVPSFYDICSAHSTSGLDTLKRALRLRSDPDCQWFRREFWRVVSAPGGQEDVDRQCAREIDQLSEKLIRHTAGRFAGNLRRILIDIRQCGPVCYLLGSNPINGLMQKLGSFLLSEAEQTRRRYDLGWRSFLLRYAEAPPTFIGTVTRGPIHTAISNQEAFWNPAEATDLARLIDSTSPSMEVLLDRIRTRFKRGIWRLNAEELSQGVFEELQTLGIVYDYEPFSPSIPQRVRLPGHIASISGLPNVATCLDLAVLFASAIESGHAHPLMFHLTHRSGDAHALAGYWKEAPLSEDVVLAEDLARQWHDIHDITAVEATGLCVDEDLRCSFRDARQRARQLLESPEWSLRFVLNVSAARRHGIFPIEENKGRSR